jgi:hypothetical protein
MWGDSVRVPVSGPDGDQRDGTVVHGLDCACCRHHELTMRELAVQTARAANGALHAARSATETAEASLALIAELKAQMGERGAAFEHSVV